MTPQAGVTQEPDADDDSEDKGLFRFMRRKPAKEKRSETEWVDTLRAQADPEAEPEMDSPFMMGEEEPPEEEPEPEGVEEPEPEPLEQYRVERQWRRRHQDEMEEIHSYIDRVIGTDRDPLARHRRLSDIGVHRHPTTRRDIASVDVEGLDEELMIAFTFPKEELRSARMVYETEGGYVIEVTRAVGGDEENIERHHYTVSRVGSVAHALDKLRARDVDDRIRREPSRTASRTPAEEAGANLESPSEWSEPRPEEESPTLTQTPEERPQETETGPEPDPVEEAPPEEAPAEKSRLGGFASRFKRDKEPTPYGADEPPVEEETPEGEAEEEAEEKPKGALGGFASRFKRDKSDDPGEPGELPSEGGSSEYPSLEDTPEESSKAGRGLGSRFKRRGKESEPEAETDAPAEADEGEEGDDEGGSKKRGLLGGIPGLKKKKGKDSDDEED